MPAGRPTVFTPALIKRVAECFFDGLNDEETSLLCDINVRTIHKAREFGKSADPKSPYAQFFAAIKKAEAARLQKYILKIRDGKQRDWVRIAWFLERRYPERFARPEIQLSFNNSYTQNNLSINISGAEAKQIEQEAKPIRDDVSSMFQNYRPASGNGNGDDTSSHKKDDM
jgi:hypothetical protein